MSTLLHRSTSGWLIAGGVILLMPPFLLAQEARKASGCTEIAPDKSVALGLYVQAKYRLPFVPLVGVEEMEADCYYKLLFTSTDAGVRFNRVLYLSPDQTRLIPTAFDIRLRPGEGGNAREGDAKQTSTCRRKAGDGQQGIRSVCNRLL